MYIRWSEAPEELTLMALAISVCFAIESLSYRSCPVTKWP